MQTSTSIFTEKLKQVQDIVNNVGSEWEQAIIISYIMYESEIETRKFCPVTKEKCNTSCSKCKAVFYSSKQAQIKDWKEKDLYDPDFGRFLKEGADAAKRYRSGGLSIKTAHLQ